MRLTCPNCGAEYEVPDEVIPTTGRDVQCSNCGDTWYQYHPDHMPDGAEEDDDLPADLSPPDTAPRVEDPDEDDLGDPAMSGEMSGEDYADTDYADGDEGFGDDEEYEADYDDEEDTPPPPRPALRRRTIAPEVQSILREEAEYEERVRGQDPLESQPDLGLGEPEPVRREDKADSRLARLRNQPGEDSQADSPEPAAAAAVAGSSRRNLLPDIEEINSTLRRKGETTRSAYEGDTRVQRRGTRRSFVAVLALLAAGAAVYLQAPAIGEAIPQLRGPMTAYVDMVDRGRGWLDEKASALAEKLDSMANETDDTPTPSN